MNQGKAHIHFSITSRLVESALCYQHFLKLETPPLSDLTTGTTLAGPWAGGPNRSANAGHVVSTAHDSTAAIRHRTTISPNGTATVFTITDSSDHHCLPPPPSASSSHFYPTAAGSGGQLLLSAVSSVSRCSQAAFFLPLLLPAQFRCQADCKCHPPPPPREPGRDAGE